MLRNILMRIRMHAVCKTARHGANTCDCQGNPDHVCKGRLCVSVCIVRLPCKHRVRPDPARRVCLGLGWQYWSNATCLIRPYLLLCAVCRRKDHQHLLHESPCLKKTRFRQLLLYHKTAYNIM